MSAKAEAEHASLDGLSGERLAEDVAGLQAGLDDAEAAGALPDRPSAERGCMTCSFALGWRADAGERLPWVGRIGRTAVR